MAFVYVVITTGIGNQIILFSGHHCSFSQGLIDWPIHIPLTACSGPFPGPRRLRIWPSHHRVEEIPLDRPERPKLNLPEPNPSLPNGLGNKSQMDDKPDRHVRDYSWVLHIVAIGCPYTLKEEPTTEIEIFGSYKTPTFRTAFNFEHLSTFSSACFFGFFSLLSPPPPPYLFLYLASYPGPTPS